MAKKTISVIILFLLVISTLTLAFKVEAVKAAGSPAPYYAEYTNLGYYGLDNVFSSLKVSGTVVLYDDYDLKPTANNRTFTHQSVANLENYSRPAFWPWERNWNDVAKSLKVSGTVTLYEDMNYSGRQATFTSNDLSYDDIGIGWNRNPGLVKNNDSWDNRTWNWLPAISDIYHPDQNNYVQWNQDGQVTSQSQDDSSQARWKDAEFNQGNVKYQNEIADLNTVGWNKKASSLMVEGSVTLYDNIGFTGDNITFTADVPDLSLYAWNDRVSSLKLTEGSRVTLYEKTDYVVTASGDGTISFQYPSYQPLPLKVSDTSSITLEGVVRDWYTDTGTGPGWTGVKFDVFATENQSDPSAKNLMLELYFVRDGDNLVWGNGIVRAPIGDNTYNALLAIDCWPQYVQRIVYAGNVEKWIIDIKGIIQRACDDFNNFPLRPDLHLDIDKLSIVKIGFTVESAWGFINRARANCTLNYLQLAYTEPPTSNEMRLDPSFVDITGKSSGCRFNVTFSASLAVPSSAWQASMDFDTNFLLVTRSGYTGSTSSQFFSGHTTSPVTPVIDNAMGIFTYGESLIGSDSRSAGSGSLCWVEFELKAPVKNTKLILNETGTFFLSPGPNVTEIPCTKYSSYVGELGWKLTVNSAHDSASPSIGECYFDNGTSVNCSVVSPVTEGGGIWICSGWSGSGSVPYSGNDSSVTFNITQDSSITWSWTHAPAHANFTYSPVPPIQNQTTTFDASSSTSGGTIVSYEWDFGEGVNVTTANPTTTYAFAYDGNHKVTLTVIDSNGLNNTIVEDIDVVEIGHNVTVMSIVANCTWVYQRALTNANVTVDNTGDFPENVWVTLYYNTTANKSINAYPVHLEIGQNYTLTFIWNTADVPCHNYTLTAVATIPTGSNTLSDGNITIRLLGDVNGDQRVDLRDISLVAHTFGSTPTSPRWNPATDICCDGKIDMQDIALTARHFGSHT